MSQKIILVVLASALAAHLVYGDTCTSEYSCTSCNTVRVCHNTPSGLQELFTYTCPLATPYCNSSGVCSSQPSVGCGPTASYPCMQDGIFPDPTDCSKYFICQNGVAYAYSCDGYYTYFNAQQGKCVYGGTCRTFNCYQQSGTKVAWGNSPSLSSYYAFCKDNGYALFVDRCPGNFKLNVKTQTCGPVCQVAGDKIADPNDCTRYFSCNLDPYAYDYTATSVQCPDFYGFDDRGNRCVPLKLLPNCDP